jgi:predicted tellurium resistance membrane protein TerC
LMGVAASLVARLLNRFRWLAWVGLAIVFYVAVTMIHDGLGEVLLHLPQR